MKKYIFLVLGILLLGFATGCHKSDDLVDTPSGEMFYEFVLDDNGLEYEVRMKSESSPRASIPEIPTSYKGLPVTKIGDRAFYNMTQLTEINIPSSVHTIGKEAFGGCQLLENIYVPESVVRIGAGAFEDTRWYANLNKSDNEVYINNVLYRYIGEVPETYEVKANTVSIADKALTFTHYLKKVIFPENSQLKYIGKGVFEDSSRLTDITLPDSVIEIGENAFHGCSVLSNINIPEGVTYLGPSAFSGCGCLKRITIPDGVTKLYNSTFSECISLIYVMIPDSVEIIEPSAFYGCYYSTLLCQTSSQPEGWECNLKDNNVAWNVISVHENDTFIYAIYENNKAGIIGLSPAIDPYNVTIPAAIDDYEIIHFTILTNPYLQNHLTSVTISVGITEISDRAFDGRMNLSTVTIPEGVKRIGKMAFRDCRNVKRITLPSGLTSIDSSAFLGCYGLESITLPDSVTCIGEGAFSMCSSLQNIILPVGVITIGSNAFFDCSKLSIYCRSKSRPSGWSSNWNISDRPVSWGYNG